MYDRATMPTEEYLLRAKNSLEKKDLIEFIENISNAQMLAIDEKELLAKITFLKVQGLYSFNQHKKALESIPVALMYNTGTEIIKLKNYEGIILGYLGKVEEAERIFRKLLSTRIEDKVCLFETLLNFVWLYLTVYKEKTDSLITEARTFLEQAEEYFELVPDSLKGKFLNSYSVYYYYINDYEKAIEVLKKAVTYCTDKYLPHIYNNLAEMYLKIEGMDYSETIHYYTEQAEVLGSKYRDDTAMARSFYLKALCELKEQKLFRALDTFYLAFEYYKKAEAYPLAFDCWVKINELMSEYKVERLLTLRESFKNDFKGTMFYNKLN